jgi:hypothetical protein
VLQEALASCQFYSFDCEMSGLYPPGLEDYVSDDVDDRCERRGGNWLG